jgi:hypothetical protein
MEYRFYLQAGRATSGPESIARSLRSPIRPREFILTFGVGGTGKSTAILEVARLCPDVLFHVMDSELQNYNRLLATAFTDLNNVVVYPIDSTEWDEYTKTIPEINEKMGRDDWLVVDFATPSWDAVQGWFVDKVHDQDIDEYFLAKRIKNQQMKDRASKGDKDTKEIKGFAALSGQDGDWQVINKTYFKGFYNALLKCPGHVYMTAEQDTIGKDDDREVKAAYGPYGIKPKGQKKLGYVPMTSLWLTKARVGKYAITTIKDRGRPELEDEPLNNFAVDYLMNVAGWKKMPVEG